MPYRLANHKNQGNYNNQRCKLYGKDYKVATLFTRTIMILFVELIERLSKLSVRTYGQTLNIETLRLQKNLKSEGKKFSEVLLKFVEKKKLASLMQILNLHRDLGIG